MAKIDVKMPQMGESITEGTVIVWHKKPGEAVGLDETLLEIGTDKVDTDVPSPAKGVLHEILVPEGETVDVGVTIAVLETEAEAASASEPADQPSNDQEAAASTSGAGQEEAATDAPEPEAVPEPSGATDGDAPGPAGEDEGEQSVVVMPQMGESITEGTVIAWHKQPGDKVELDETLLEIGTDKVDTEVPSPAAGYLAEILVPEGETVDVGTDIAVISSTKRKGGSTAPSKAPSTPDREAEPSKPSGAGASDKAGGEKARSKPSVDVSTEKVSSVGDGAFAVPQLQESEEIPRRGPDGQFFSPLVRSIAEKEGVTVRELGQIEGSGRDGRLTKQDLLAYLKQRKEAPAGQPPEQRPAPIPAPPLPEDGGRVEIIEMDRMRQIIAEHMVRSKATSAHVTSFAEVDVTNLVRVRERNKKSFQDREGIKLSYTPFMVDAAVKALREHPIVNASVDGTRIILKKDYHIGIAVAIDSSRLVVPVIRNAGQLNLAGIAHAASDLAERARNKRLQPDDLRGGTFTVTNIGSIGSLMGTPIINQPQVAILATGAIKKKPVVLEDPNLGDIIAIRHMMFISLSYDHRVIDGAMAASYLQRFVSILESHRPDAVL